jgi:ketosteroid isomerase-like protein
MEPLWFHNAYVMLVNPRDKSVSVGWDDVKKNWENAFNFWSNINVTQTAGPYVRVDGNVAWSTGLTITNAKAKNGTSVNLPTFESDVLKKDSDGEWKLESHSAWRVSQ